ncbi:DUF4382 domain-containing protein [Colwelliaceae bacterium BS250]
MFSNKNTLLKVFTKKIKLIPISLLIGSSFLLAACGSDSDDDKTMVSFAVADAPVDHAEEVVVAIDAIELVREGEENIMLDVSDGDLSYAQVDLKQFQGGDSKIILDETELAPGVYQNLILHVLDDSDGDDYSYVTEMENGSKVPMKQPSQKLKLGGFEVVAGGVQRFTIHFDLRTALVENKNGQRYNLKPHGVTIVDNETVASLSGMVNVNLFCDADLNAGNFVYLYPGHDLTEEQLVDNYNPAVTQINTLPVNAVAPMYSTAVTMVTENEDVGYRYAFGFIPEGDYTVAFTCSGANDDEEQYDELMIANPTDQLEPVVLSNDEDKVYDFVEKSS